MLVFRYSVLSLVGKLKVISFCTDKDGPKNFHYLTGIAN